MLQEHIIHLPGLLAFLTFLLLSILGKSAVYSKISSDCKPSLLVSTSQRTGGTYSAIYLVFLNLVISNPTYSTSKGRNHSSWQLNNTPQYTCHIFFIHSLSDGPQLWFHCLVLQNCFNNHEQVGIVFIGSFHFHV